MGERRPRDEAENRHAGARGTDSSVVMAKGEGQGLGDRWAQVGGGEWGRL